MAKYLGETIVDIKDTPFANYQSKDWALYYIGSYGQIDGSHHKQWVLDQVARILNGTPVLVSLAKWDNGHKEYRPRLDDEPSAQYNEWVKEMMGEYDEENDEYEYSYDCGVAP